MFSIGVFHFSDEALKVQGSGSANHDLTNTCVATLSVAAKSANLGGNKVARSGRQIEQNEVPKPGPQNRQFCGDPWAYPHSMSSAVSKGASSSLLPKSSLSWKHCNDDWKLTLVTPN